MLAIFQKPIFISALVFLSGSLCALGMAPYNYWPVFFIGFGVLYWVLDRADTHRAAFLYGWLWAFGYFVFSLYWIGNALLVEGNPYKWAYPLAVCGLPALLAFFNGFACFIAKRFCDLKQWHGYLGFVSALSLFEYFRGHLFTGFPWNLYGYTWVDFTPIAKLAFYESIYFLTFVSVFWMSCVGFFIVTKSPLQKRILSTAVLISFFGAFYLGTQSFAKVVPNSTHDVQIKIVQPNTDQAEKWQRDKMVGHFENVLRLSQADGNDEGLSTLILWPETTISPQFLDAPFYRGQIADMLQGYQGEAILMSGALRKDEQSYYNSLLTIDAGGEIDRIYDKSHLVPFGEYIPFQEMIPLAPITQFQGFQKGDGPVSTSILQDLTYSPLICYEILFPGKAVQSSDKPDFIVNVTNDAWYGNSAGPHQHLVKAQFRAIEEGLPVLRAANTGVSAIIDANGRISGNTKTFTQEVLSMKLPQKNSGISVHEYTSLFLFPIIPLCLLILAIANTCNVTHRD